MHTVKAVFPGHDEEADGPLSDSENAQLVALIEKSRPEDWGIENSYSNEEPVSVEAWASYPTASAAMKAKMEWQAWADSKNLSVKISAKKMRALDDDEPPPVTMVDTSFLKRPREVSEAEAETMRIADEELRNMGFDDDEPAPVPRGTKLRLVPKRNPSMTWGTLPEFPAFKADVEAARDDDDEPVIGPPGNIFHMELTGQDVMSAKKALKALFSAGSRVAFEQFEGRNKKFGLRFHDLVSLHKFILALLTVSEMEAEEHPDGTPMEGPADLASSIMGMLGYEWV